MANNFYGATSLIGGVTGALDKIDGADLANQDAALVVTTTKVYVYFLNATSGVVESSPDVVKPDTNAGTKRWILKKAIMDYADITGNDAATDVTAAELEELSDASETTLHSHAEGGTTDDHSDISANDAATDVTGAELEELTDASETTLHSHAEGGTIDDHSDISANDGATDVTGAELEELTDASETTLHSHAEGGSTDDYSDISANDGATDVTGAELEELTDGSATTKHSHAGAGGETYVDRGDPAAIDWGIGTGITDDNTWRELDMSSVVPAAAANKLVVLEVTAKGSGLDHMFVIRENGNTNAYNAIHLSVMVSNQLMTKSSEVVMLDADRKVEYKAKDTLTVATISVRGWWI